MPKVLITRPKAMADLLAIKLQALGYQTAVDSLLSVQPIVTPLPQNEIIDAVMVTSANAMLALRERCDEISNLFELPCFCVGPGTAEKARALGFRWVQNTEGDGVELAGFICGTYAAKPVTLLHIAGREVKSAGRRQLETRGHKIIDWTVYETLGAKTLAPGTMDLLRAKQLDAVLIFSPKTAQIFAELLGGSGLEACCAGLSAICLSLAVAEELKSIPLRHLMTSALPTEEDVIACLQESCPATP